MTAYSFKRRFVDPILAGTKRQTIRAIGKRRHASPGGELQLYYGMRTKQCRLIARAPCLYVSPIKISLARDTVDYRRNHLTKARELDKFARADGFADFADMRRFWHEEHATTSLFKGKIVEWGQLFDEEAARTWFARNVGMPA